MVRHVVERNAQPDMNMIAPNPLRKRQSTRNNSKRCKASADAAKSSSLAAASSSSAAAKSSASVASAKSSASAASAAAASKSAEAKKKQEEEDKSSEKPAPTTSKKNDDPQPTKDSGDSNSGKGLTTGGIATFFSQNGVAGACGKVHSDNDIVCALQTQTYDNGANCGKTVAITNTKTGKTVNVLVADECPTCNDPQSIDLSNGAYKALGGTVEEGIFPIAWKIL